MDIYVNGEKKALKEGSSIAELVSDLGYENKRIAVELNKEILPFDQYVSKILTANDRLEIVQAIGGGQSDAFTIAELSWKVEQTDRRTK